MGRPSESTAKKLFALTGNRCAFPGCTTRLVDPKENGANARICHIKGNRDGSARYEKNQPEEERQGLANLVAMCANHSDKIDNLSMVDTYSVPWLLDVKAKHEAQFLGDVVNDPAAEQFAHHAINRIIEQTFVFSMNQNGGQTAGTIVNVNLPSVPMQESFKSDLQSRNLGQPSSPDFGNTVYRKHHKLVDLDGTAGPLPSAAIYFAKLPSQIVAWSERRRLLEWMDPNARRYEPFSYDFFIPTLTPDVQNRGLTWTDGEKYRFGRSTYMRYLAVEPAGYIEYGIYPGSIGDPEPIVYYAKILGHAIAFLEFVRDISSQFGIDTDTIGLGLALFGTDGKYLRGIDEWSRHSSRFKTPSSERSLLYLHEPTNSSWTTEDVALDLAATVLSHWGHPTPAHGPTPEFENHMYKGPFFKQNFQRFCN